MEEEETPNDEFEIYFQKAARDKMLVRIQYTNDPVERRGSLPTASTRIQIDEAETVPRGSDENHHQEHHHRASSCKGSKQLHHSPSARAPSPKRSGYVDAKPAVSGNGFLSPQSAAGDTTAVNSSSAPQSRTGSFKKVVQPRRGSIKELYEQQEAAAASTSGERRRSSVYLEETVAAKLKELKDLESDNCLVVRQFTMSPKGDIVNRIDSFKKKRTPSPHGATTPTPKAPPAVRLQVPGADLRLPGKPTLARNLSCDRLRRVLVIGDRRVGKTALMTQFMTSEYLAALDTSFEGDTENEKTISVSVDGEELTLHFTDLEPEEEQEHHASHPDVDCYLLVYSIADRKSFTYVSRLLRDLNEIKRSFAMIVVANKSDVVRKRQVPDSDAMDLCEKYSAKFIEVSAALNHKVDELLVGIVNQIRLNPKRREKLERGSSVPEEPPTPSSVPCSKGPRSFLSRLFSKKKKGEKRPCEDFQTL